MNQFKVSLILGAGLALFLGNAMANPGQLCDYKEARKAYDTLVRDKNASLGDISNAFSRVLSSTNITLDAKSQNYFDFAVLHKNRKLTEEALSLFEAAANVDGAKASIRARALTEEANYLRRFNFDDKFGTYHSDDLKKALEVFSKVESIPGLSGMEIINARENVAKALLDIAQGVTPEALAIYESLPKIPGLSEDDIFDAENKLSEFYLKALSYDKSRVIAEKLLNTAFAKNMHPNTKTSIARRLLTIAEKTKGSDEVARLISSSPIKDAINLKDLGQYLLDAGRTQEAIAKFRAYLADEKEALRYRTDFLSGDLIKSLGVKDQKLIATEYEKMLLEYTSKNSAEWTKILTAIDKGGWRSIRNTAIGQKKSFNDWLFALNAKAPKEFQLPVDAQFRLALKTSDPSKAMNLAKEVIASEKTQADVKRKAAFYVAIMGSNEAAALKGVIAAINAGENIDAGKMANQLKEATIFALELGKEKTARTIYGDYLGRFITNTARSLDCQFVKNAPENISDILSSKMYRESKKGLVDRKYGNNLKHLLETDAAITGRKLSEGDASTPPPELFTFCDEKGVKILINVFVSKEEIAKFKAGFGGLPGYEAYLASGIDDPYSCFLFGPPETIIETDFVTQYDNGTGFRGLTTRKNNILISHYTTEKSVATLLSVSWNAYFHRIPSEGDKWYFEPLVWTQGGLSWGGSESVHNRSSYGAFVFKNMTKENRIAIKRSLLPTALGLYNNSKSSRNGCIEIWLDNELGDRDFYFKSLKPVVDKLDGFANKIKLDMTDVEVEEVFDNAANDMFNIEYVVSQLRREYLDEKRVSGE